MRTSLAIIVVFSTVACGTPAERAAEHALHVGEQAYRQAQFQGAADIYATAAHDPRVAYDLGNALYRLHQLDSALAWYRHGVDSSGQLTPARNYNVGNAWFGIAQVADSSSQRILERMQAPPAPTADIGLRLRQAVEWDSLSKARTGMEALLDSALLQSKEAFRQILRTVPKDEDARHNLALVQRWIAARVKEATEHGKNNDKKEDKDLTERAKRLMLQADSLVDNYRFQDALQLLQNALKSEPTLQQRQEYMNKLDVVTKAAAAK